MSNPNRAVRTHTSFIEIKIHTAKCDTCNKHNTSTMFRCADCGQQCCTACWTKKGGDGTHILNAGDKGWTPERAQVLSMPRRERRPKKTNENGVAKRRTTKRKSRYVIDDDDEEEEKEDDDEEAKDEENDETVEEGEVIEKRTRKAAISGRKSDAVESRKASTAFSAQNHQAGPSNPQPPTRSTATQTNPSVLAAADSLLLNAIDPTSPTADGFSMILKAAAQLDGPQAQSQATSASRSYGPASEASLQQDAQAQTPLLMEDVPGVGLDYISEGTQETKSHRVTGVDEKGKDRKVEDNSAEEGERSVMWE